jgi:hypothetical protein
MARIESGRVYSVQYQLISSGMECAPDWFTKYSEAQDQYYTICAIKGVYQNVRLVELKLPDRGEVTAAVLIRG